MDGEQQQTISFAEFELDPAHRQLRRNGKALALYAKTFDLLTFLLENNGRIISKDELLEKVWAGQFVEEANLSVQISALRKALGEKRDAPRFLVTIPGKGYKFVADIQNGRDEIVIEKHKYSQITIEQETRLENENEDSAINKSTTVLPVPEKFDQSQNGFKMDRRKFIAVASAGLICILIAFGSYFYFQPRKAKSSFQKINLKRLTNTGKVVAAAISPDGKYLAYVQGDNEGNSLWIQQIGTASHIQLLPPTKASFWDLVFSPDGAFIYYNLFFGDKTDPELSRIPSLGGIVQKIPNVATFSISFAPDGQRMAFISPDSANGFSYLTITDTDGSNKQFIGKKAQPDTFIDGHLISWSPDGETIACFVNHFEAGGNFQSVVLINVRDGTEKPIGSRQWHDVESLKWLKDGSGLLVIDAEKFSDRNQIWFLSYPEGETRPVINDLNSYYWASETFDSNSFVAIQTATTSGIFVGEPGANEFKEITSEVGELSPLVWMPDGKIVFRSTADGVSNLWIIDADGNNRRQLTVNAEVGARGFCAPPDGKYIVFMSWRSGKSNLWRVDANGKNLTQLTNGEADAYPQCTPDSNSVVYQKGILTKQRLWKVPISGGEPVQLTDFFAKWNAISRDGNNISYFYLTKDKWRFGFISLTGSKTLPEVDVPANLKKNVVYWSPDGRDLFYIDEVGSVGNIWSMSIDGAQETKPVTNFTSHQLIDFSLSPDGKRLALDRSLSVSDVVLIENIKSE